MNKYNARRFEGKVALLTASTNGIGYATAERLAHEGCKIVISSRNQINVDHALKQLENDGIPRQNMAGVKCHVGAKKDRQKLVDFAIQTFGKIDVLVNNAGINMAVGSIMDATEAQYDKIFETNVKAGFLLTRLVVPHMEKNGGGVIIFNGSIGAYLIGKEITVYGLSKTGLLRLTQALSKELAPKQIRVNSVVPGIVRAGMSRLMWDKHFSSYDTASESVKGVERQVKSCVLNLFHRIAESEEIASAIAYLASQDASFVTGENHLLVGGTDCRL